MSVEINDDLIRTKLIKARLRLLRRHPFFGQLAIRLNLINADDWCLTAATNGKDLFYNTKFIESLTDDETIFLVTHELYHCIYQHFIRRNNRNHTYWNMAADYVINLYLVENKIGKFIKSGLLDNKFKDMVTEEVYEILVKTKAPHQSTLDVHLDLSADVSIESDANGNRIKGLSAAEHAALADELKQVMLQTAQSTGAGNLPGDIKRVIDSLTESKMNWRDYIKESIESTIKSDFSWLRLNRKGWHHNSILPGMIPDNQINICIGIDTSGSISNTILRDMLSEVNGIMEQYKSYSIKIWQFDTKCYGYAEFTNDDGMSILDYQIKGGGGTDFMANWNFMTERDIVPDQFLMFTDGEPFGKWGDPNYCDTLFIIHSNPKKIAPFGATVHYTK